MENNPYAKQSSWRESRFGDAGAEDAVDENEGFESARSAHDILAEDDVGDDESEARPPFSVLGRSLNFKGELSAEEDLLIQGSVEGKINHSANNLTIGAHGDVKADITANRVIAQGKIQGDTHASESVVVEPSARVQGDIFAPRVGLKEGAKFKGRIDMDGDAAARKSASTASEKNDGGGSGAKKTTKSGGTRSTK